MHYFILFRYTSVLFCEEFSSLKEATEKVLEDLLGQHEAEKSKLSSSLAALETTRTELEQRISVLTDKLNEKNDDTGSGPIGYHTILIRGPFHPDPFVFYFILFLFRPFMIIDLHNMIRKYHMVNWWLGASVLYHIYRGIFL